MSGPSKRSSLESVSIGYLLIAFAVSVLLALTLKDWTLFIPFFFIAAGAFYLVLGFVLRPTEMDKRAAMRNSFFHVFWGGTLGLVGIGWIINRQWPGNFLLLLMLFIIWIGGIILVMSLPRLRGSMQPK